MPLSAITWGCSFAALQSHSAGCRKHHFFILQKNQVRHRASRNRCLCLSVEGIASGTPLLGALSSSQAAGTDTRGAVHKGTSSFTVSLWGGPFLVTDEPILTHYCHPECIVYIRVHSWCCTYYWGFTNVWQLLMAVVSHRIVSLL